ncbi:N-acetylmuramoyl-L-alanine amidase [Oceanobacillus longus]|uniref:N-acetylmuramoyl-L-alanine amidase n=1 Tax=Oceanobacillus longus TaxID=930120 RepID=A0ABV8GVU0_9BACI
MQTHSRKLMFILFTAIIFLYSANVEIVYADEAIIEGSNLNIRSGPGTDYDSVGVADTGESYTIIQEKNGWVEIELPGGSGWVAEDFTTVTESSEEDEETEKETDVSSITIQHEHTQLREGPSTDYDIIHFAEKGIEYDVLSAINEWYEIDVAGQSGYILKDLVSEPKEASNKNVFKNKTIIIDAGHGGRDVGAIGTTDTYEKSFTYLTAHELEQELQYLGANVLLTREEDEFISLSSRSTYSNFNDTDAFISIHYNSVPELPNVSGIESFYYADQNENLAKYIQQGIIKETDESDRGIAKGDFQVLRTNLKPSVLLELGFISNPEREALLQTNAYQKKLVTGIVEGLRKYFSE